MFSLAVYPNQNLGFKNKNNKYKKQTYSLGEVTSTRMKYRVFQIGIYTIKQLKLKTKKSYNLE